MKSTATKLELGQRVMIDSKVYVIHHVDAKSNQALAHEEGTEVGEKLSYRLMGDLMKTLRRGYKDFTIVK